ncbi:MAG: major facilitator superfamily 1 [Actinomycetia bacterium]|nr:major facilitator superfamily 1 [Actinomycetes bacterium]
MAPRRDRFRLTLILVAISAFMITMDNTVFSVSQEKMLSSLHITAPVLEWATTGYILIFSCLMIAGGRLTDIYGSRTMFVIGMTVFTSASLTAGLCGGSFGLLMGARLIQGTGAALALPATLVIVTVGRSDEQKSIGSMVWIITSSASLALGPTIAGYIVQTWDWHWLFLINVVPGVLAILTSFLVLRAPQERSDIPVDLPGLLISATTIFSIAYALTEGPSLGWGSPAAIGVYALGAIGLVSLATVERWAPSPMFETSFFRNRIFVGGVVSQMLCGLGFNGVVYFGSKFMLKVLAFKPAEAGLVFLPPSLVMGAVTPLAFWLAAKYGPRLTIGGGMALMAIGMMLFSALKQGSGYSDLMPGVLVLGAGSALCMPLAVYVLKSIPEERIGVGNGILNVARELSGAFGIAVLGALIFSLQNTATERGVDKVTAYRQGTSIGLVAGACMVMIGALIAALTLPRREKGPRHRRVRVVPVAVAELATVPASVPEPRLEHTPVPPVPRYPDRPALQVSWQTGPLPIITYEQAVMYSEQAAGEPPGHEVDASGPNGRWAAREPDEDRRAKTPSGYSPFDWHDW